MRLVHVRRRAHCKRKLTRSGAPTSPKQQLVSALSTLSKTRCSAAGSQGAASGFDAAISGGPIARPATCPYCPCACPARRHVNGTGPAPALGPLPWRHTRRGPALRRAWRAISASSSLPPGNPAGLTRANDRLDRARVIVLDVTDPRAHRPVCHLSCREGGITHHLVGAGEDRGRDRQAERLGSLEVDDQLEGRRLLDREIGRLGAVENFRKFVALIVQGFTLDPRR